MSEHDVPVDKKNNATKKAFIGVTLILLMILALSPVVLNAHHQKRLTECRTNLKNLGTAMEMYSTDWSGHYPAHPEKLTPKYIAALPTCPNSHRSYQVILGPDAPGNEPNFEDYFYIFCQGQNHEKAGVGTDQPAFDQMATPPEF